MELEDDSEPDAGLRAFLLDGELRLLADQTFELSLIARYDTAAGASYTTALDSRGAWRFLASALDDESGEITLVSAHGAVSSAAVTWLSLVHRTGPPWRAERGHASTWVYLRRRHPGQ